MVDFFFPLELLLIRLDYNSQATLGKKYFFFFFSILQAYCNYLQTAFIFH